MAETEKYRVVVLNDGETYTDLDGCFVLSLEVPQDKEIPEHELDDAVKAAAHLYKSGESVTLDNGVKVTFDDWIDERLGNDV